MKGGRNQGAPSRHGAVCVELDGKTHVVGAADHLPDVGAQQRLPAGYYQALNEAPPFVYFVETFAQGDEVPGLAQYQFPVVAPGAAEIAVGEKKDARYPPTCRNSPRKPCSGRPR